MTIERTDGAGMRDLARGGADYTFQGDTRFPLGGDHGHGARVLEPVETVPHPDTPHRRRRSERPEAADPTAHRPRRAPYAELHAHSAYSFLDGASQPEELAASAAELGYAALALTDHDGVYGSLEFAQAAKAFGVRPITGAEVTLADGSHVTLLVESALGYANLCRLLTSAHADTRIPGKERELLEAALATGSPSETRTRLRVWRRRSAATVSSSSCSGRSSGGTPAGTRSCASWPRRCASRPSLPATSMRTIRAGRPCRTRSLP